MDHDAVRQTARCIYFVPYWTCDISVKIVVMVMMILWLLFNVHFVKRNGMDLLPAVFYPMFLSNSYVWPLDCTNYITHHSRLHAQLNLIKVIVRLCSAIRQLQFSVNRFIGRSMSYPGTIGSAVPISTSGNRATG